MQHTVRKFTPEQMQLVSEFTQDYGIAPEQIVFFGDDPKPLFDVEAGAVLARELAGVQGIAVGLTESHAQDTITMECGLTFEGYFASATGSANVNEEADGQPMSRQRIERLASSRAMRSALIFAGKDLVKLHRQRRTGVLQFTGPDKSNRERLLGRAHALGKEVGLVYDNGEKHLWRAMLSKRYGVDSSAVLADEKLEDLCAFLSSLRPKATTTVAA